MLRRIPTLMGLNLRQSEINRPPEFAQDCRNVEKNSKGEVVLRWGYEKVLDELGIIDLFEYVGAQSDPNRGALLALKADGLYRLDSGALVPLPAPVATQPTWSAQTKPVEYNKVLYWNDPDLNVDLWKFDGYAQYRAGIPRPQVTVTTGSGTAYYWRILYTFSDPQGNIVWSDYQEETIRTNSASLNVNVEPLSNQQFDQFYNRFANNPTGQVVDDGTFLGNSPTTNPVEYTDSSFSNVIDVTFHNYEVGDYVLLGDYQGGRRRPIQIVGVSPTTIAFDSSQVGSDSFTVFQSNIGPLEDRWNIRVFRSQNEFTNYQEVTSGAFPSTRINNINATTAVTFSSVEDLQLGEVYDDSLVRINPPKSKYMTLYNEFMVLGNIDPDNGVLGFAALLGNDTRLEDAIVWSDIATLSNGSSIETFLVNNVRSVGASEDGALVALHGNDDNLVVHKEKQSYYLNGDLITNTLRVRKAMTESIGTASHRSIRNVEGGHLYTTPRGVYLSVGGSKPVELSEIIEPLFTDNALELDTLLLDQAKSVTDFLREKIYIYIPQQTDGGIVLVYDYYHKDWWLHDNIPADKGFQDVGISSTEIYFADSTGLYRRDLTSQKDLTKKINAYYWTGWFDLEAPTVVKKFINFIMLSIAKKDFTATIKGYCNWQTGTEEASNTIDFSDKVSSEDSQVLQVQANSVSYRISNEKCGGDLHITSYEVEYEPTQTKPKGTA